MRSKRFSNTEDALDFQRRADKRASLDKTLRQLNSERSPTIISLLMDIGLLSIQKLSSQLFPAFYYTFFRMNACWLAAYFRRL